MRGFQYGACVSIRGSPVCVPSGSTCPSESYLSHSFTDLEQSCLTNFSWCGWFLCTSYKDALLRTWVINGVTSLRFSFELYHTAGDWLPTSHREVPGFFVGFLLDEVALGHDIFRVYRISGRFRWARGLRLGIAPLACRDYVFESRWGHEVSVVCFFFLHSWFRASLQLFQNKRQ